MNASAGTNILALLIGGLSVVAAWRADLSGVWAAVWYTSAALVVARMILRAH